MRVDPTLADAYQLFKSEIAPSNKESCSVRDYVNKRWKNGENIDKLISFANKNIPMFDFHIKDITGHCVLYATIKHHKYSELQQLIEAGININHTYKDSCDHSSYSTLTALFDTLNFQKLSETDKCAFYKTFEVLCKHDADFNIRGRSEELPLHVAIKNNYPVEIIQEVIKRTKNINDNKTGVTPLIYTVSLCQENKENKSYYDKVIKVLLDAGANAKKRVKMYNKYLKKTIKGEWGHTSEVHVEIYGTAYHLYPKEYDIDTMPLGVEAYLQRKTYDTFGKNFYKFSIDYITKNLEHIYFCHRPSFDRFRI